MLKTLKQNIYAISGSRNLPDGYFDIVQFVVRSLAWNGHTIYTGDAKGADQFARDTGLISKVFTPAMIDGNYSYSQKLMRRSALMVDQSDSLIAFPDKPCPDKMPAPILGDKLEKFMGFGTGTWTTCAYALARGQEIFIFPCGFDQLPDWGNWQHGKKHGAKFARLKLER